MGGLLSNPATKFPRWFSHPLYQRYPYFLPCLAAGLVAFAGAIYGFFYLKEVRYCSISFSINMLIASVDITQ